MDNSAACNGQFARRYYLETILNQMNHVSVI